MGATKDFFYFCSWCHKSFSRKVPINKKFKFTSDKKYIACSKECQKMLSSVFQSKEWKSLSEKDQRNLGGTYGMKHWYEDREAEKVSKVTKYLQANRRTQLAKVKRSIPKKVETILKAHSEVLGKDPDSLLPEFIEKTIGKKSTS